MNFADYLAMSAVSLGVLISLFEVRSLRSRVARLEQALDAAKEGKP